MKDNSFPVFQKNRHLPSAQIQCEEMIRNENVFYISMMKLSNRAIPVLLALCEGNPPVTGGFPSPRPVTRSFDGLFDLRRRKGLCKHLRRHGAHHDVTLMFLEIECIYSEIQIPIQFVILKHIDR